MEFCSASRLSIRPPRPCLYLLPAVYIPLVTIFIWTHPQHLNYSKIKICRGHHCWWDYCSLPRLLICSPYCLYLLPAVNTEAHANSCHNCRLPNGHSRNTIIIGVFCFCNSCFQIHPARGHIHCYPQSVGGHYIMEVES